MNKYINADELIDEIIFNEEDGGIIGSKEVIDIIKNMPSADVAEIVRCGECKYSYYDPVKIRETRLYCSRDFPATPRWTFYDFCSRGERRAE